MRHGFVTTGVMLIAWTGFLLARAAPFVTIGALVPMTRMMVVTPREGMLRRLVFCLVEGSVRGCVGGDGGEPGALWADVPGAGDGCGYSG